jgi:hypothetical protein
METRGSFQNVINAVKTTGVGYKTFFFRTNMTIEEIVDDEDVIVSNFPNDYWRTNGKFIIKFSDGNSLIGSMVFTEKELAQWYDPDSFNSDEITLHKCGFIDNEEIKIVLTYEVFPSLDENMVGEAFIEITAKDHLEIEKWFEEGL